EDIITGRYDQGDPATFEEVLVAVRLKFKSDNKDDSFQTLLRKEARLRTWLRRLIARVNFSERAGTISQKVPVNFDEIARATLAQIRKTAIDQRVDVVINMDETFVLF